MSIFLQSATQVAAGAQTRLVRLPVWPSVELLGAHITRVQIAIFILAFVGLYFLRLLVYRTELGAQIRAVADNMELARVLGINTDRVVSAVFAVGSALAAVAGVLVGLEINIHPAMGFAMGVKAFAAVVLGGIGSVPGAIVGAFVIGLAENIGAWYLGGVWKEPVAYVIVLATLLVKPTGLFGGKLEEEVKL